MPYLVSSIIAVVSAMIILFTRYEADDSSITAELETMKSMFITLDGFVNTYIESGGNLTSISIEELYDNGILLGNMEKGKEVKVVVDKKLESTLTFPRNEVIWQIIPNKDDASSYKVLVDMTKNSSLMSKAVFSESFSGREYCEKMLFGTFQTGGKKYIEADLDFSVDATPNKKDGLFVCIVYK